MKKQVIIKRPNVFINPIFIYFDVKDPFKKDDTQQKDFFIRSWPLNKWFYTYVLQLSPI